MNWSRGVCAHWVGAGPPRTRLQTCCSSQLSCCPAPRLSMRPPHRHRRAPNKGGSCLAAPPAGRLVRRPGQAAPFSRARRLAAVFAVFVVSGLMHEALFW